MAKRKPPKRKKRATAHAKARPRRPSSARLEYIEPSIQHLAIPVAELKADADNLRTHSARNLEVIRRSLVDFRQQTPIVRDGDGVVRKGNGTLQAAIALGWSHVAVVDSSLTGKAAELYAVADNRSGDQEVGSGWADEALAQFLSDLAQDPTTDVEAAGFTADEVQDLIAATVADLEDADKKQTREVKLTERFAVLVNCEGEDAQRTVFALLEAKGYACRVVTL